MSSTNVYADSASRAYHTGAVRRAPRAVAGSRSLAAMLPTILSTGVITLVATAVMRLLWLGFNNEFFGAWMEAWLTTWAIAFPVAYLSKPLVYGLTRSISQPAVQRRPGLCVADVLAASEQATASAGLQVKRPDIVRYY
ncbi:MAG: DUF2798 domain-containing protein [Burkholderiales bacterium]|nr:DUF2798 domain-containing protein [Burkholderiales bacterium]